MLAGVFSLLLALLPTLCQGKTLFVLSRGIKEYKTIVKAYSHLDRNVEVINLNGSLIAAKRVLRLVKLNERYSSYVFMGSLSDTIYEACKSFLRKPCVVALSVGIPRENYLTLFPSPSFILKLLKGEKRLVICYPQVLREIALSYSKLLERNGVETTLIIANTVSELTEHLAATKKRSTLLLFPLEDAYTRKGEKVLKKLSKTFKVIGFGKGPYTISVLIDFNKLADVIYKHLRGERTDKDCYFYVK